MKRFVYYNECSKDTFLKIINNVDNSSIYNVLYKEDKVQFYSNNPINNELVNSVNIVTRFFKKIILPNLIFILGFILILFIFSTTPYYIREVRYDKGSAQDQVILEYVKGKVSNHKLEISINDLSKEMLIKFPHYAFIGLSKRGSIIYVKIEIQDSITKIPTFDNLKGDFVSKYNAYIENIIIERGSVLVALNTTVKIGDTLVSGNLKYLNNPNDTSLYVSPKGVIIGKIIEKKTLKVKKINTYKSYTGKYKEYKSYYLFNKPLNNTLIDDSNYLKEEKVINFFNLFKMVRKIEYYKEDVTFVYDLSNIEDYTKSLIYYDLEKNRTSSYEKINNIKTIGIMENEEYIEVVYLIDKSINIVSFKEIL